METTYVDENMSQNEDTENITHVDKNDTSMDVTPKQKKKLTEEDIKNAQLKAEELKNKGNEEFKKGNFATAINYYTEALGK